MAVSHARRFSGMTQNLPDGMLLQRIQERKECLFLFRAQFAEALPLVFGLAAVALDGAFQRQGPEIMQCRGCMGSPHSGTVRNLFAVSCGGFWTIESHSSHTPTLNFHRIIFLQKHGGGTCSAPSFSASPTHRSSARAATPATPIPSWVYSQLPSHRGVGVRSVQTTSSGDPSAFNFQLSTLSIHYPLLTVYPLKPQPHMAHPYLCTRKKGPAAREPRYSPCAAS